MVPCDYTSSDVIQEYIFQFNLIRKKPGTHAVRALTVTWGQFAGIRYTDAEICFQIACLN